MKVVGKSRNKIFNYKIKIKSDKNQIKGRGWEIVNEIKKEDKVINEFRNVSKAYRLVKQW